MNLASALALLACNSGPAPTSLPAIELPAGTTMADHVEVAEGVYLLADALAAGTVDWIGPEGTVPEPPPAEDLSSASAKASSSRYCYNYDSTSWSDTTVAGELLGGNPTVYLSMGAYSTWYFNGAGRPPTDTDSLSIYMGATAPTAVDTLSLSAYLYVDGTYIGYLTTYNTDTSTESLGSGFSFACPAGSPVTVEATVYASLQNYTTGNDSLYMARSIPVSLTCCN